MNLITVLVIALILSFSAYAQEIPEKHVSYYVIKVKAGEKATLAKMLGDFVKDDAVINKKTKMVKRIFKANKKVKNWRRIKKGTTIKLYISKNFMDQKKLKAYKGKVKRRPTKKYARYLKKKKKMELRKKMAQKKQPKVHRFNAFYMASMGKFNQTGKNDRTVDFEQNSPVTLGTMYAYHPNEKEYSISASVFYSYLVTAESNTDQETIDVPSEVGLNVYYEQPVMKNAFKIYGGLDIEQFNTFNLSDEASSADVKFDQNMLGYATFGLTKAFNVKSQQFVFKTSISQSVFSTRTAAYSGDTDGTYGGSKAMLFLMTGVADNLYLTSLLKYHVLSGPSDVTTVRTGIGLSYSF